LEFQKPERSTSFQFLAGNEMGFSEKVLKLRVLIVEDNASFREILKEKLQTVSFSMVIDEATEGREVVEKVEVLKPEVVFMDIRLPGENGLQLTQKIKAKYPNTKVIFLTSYDSLEYRNAAIRSGGSCYISKDSLHCIQIEKLLKSILE